MNYQGPYCYTLFLSGEKYKRIISKKTFEGKESNFKTEVTKKQTPKIYILKYEGEIVYVGYTSQSINKRLRQGIRSSGVNKNLGYKWKHLPELELLVFVFDKELKGNKHEDDKPFIEFAEAVEAELVYLIRNKTGNWPKYQNEIHFNNKELEKATEVACKMYITITE